MREIGIYIHIPFCMSKCYYCDFCSLKVEPNCDIVEEYIDSVCAEIMANIDLMLEYKITTIYFGGGTPSHIDAKYIEKILGVLKLLNQDIEEITIEINPGSCDMDKLRVYKSIGINRLSIGLQSINDNTLEKIGRMTKFADFNRLYKEAVSIGFDNISVDLIIGLPEQTKQEIEETVNYLSGLEAIKHISAYSLEVHENTKLDFLVTNKFIELPTEDEERDIKHLLDERLTKYGFKRYEISNYAKQGFRSNHNLKYWNQECYLGFGASAASYIDSARYTNTSNVNKYIKCMQEKLPCKEEIEELDKLAQIKEYIILRLRLREGIVKKQFKDIFKVNIYELYKTDIDYLIENDLLIDTGENIMLTEKGNDLANIVWQKFI